MLALTSSLRILAREDCRQLESYKKCGLRNCKHHDSVTRSENAGNADFKDATYPGSQDPAISAVDDATHSKFDVQAYRDCEDAANTVSTDGTDADNDEANTCKALIL